MEKVKLGDICEILNGYAFKSDLYEDSGIRIMRITNVQNGYIEDSDPKFYGTDKESEIKKYLLKENDLLISLTGNVGRVGMMCKDLLPAALNQRVACIRVKDDKKVNINYMFSRLNNKRFENNCIINSKGIAQKNLSTEWLKDYVIELPKYAEQIKIADKMKKVEVIIKTRKEQEKELNQIIKSQFVENVGFNNLLLEVA